jgi:hypothetical protein
MSFAGVSASAATTPTGAMLAVAVAACAVCRRLECYHCYTARPANPRRVTSDLNEPSNILKVSGLEPNARYEASPHHQMLLAASVGSFVWIPLGDCCAAGNSSTAVLARAHQCVRLCNFSCHLYATPLPCVVHPASPALLWCWAP